MDAFTIQIAGLAVGVQPLFISTREYFRAYLSEREPEILIEVLDSDLVYEQQMLDREALEEGLKFRKFTGPFLERAVIQRKVAVALLGKDTLMVHGSTVSVDGCAYLFAAPCGTGKSTHTRLWREIFGSRAVMVNDDKPFLTISSSGVIAHGSPWSGKHGLDTNISVPLRGICLLRRGSDNRISQVTAEDCYDELLHYCFVPEGDTLREKANTLVKELVHSIPLWRLECNKAPQAALVSYQAMHG